jgi:hypothetical protein
VSRSADGVDGTQGPEIASPSPVLDAPRAPQDGLCNDGCNRIADLERALGRLTRDIANAPEEADVDELVAERRAMRDELRVLREAEARADGKVVERGG